MNYAHLHPQTNLHFVNFELEERECFLNFPFAHIDLLLVMLIESEYLQAFLEGKKSFKHCNQCCLAGDMDEREFLGL
jgi:hypothetical protein